jgi:hypothetical protein
MPLEQRHMVTTHRMIVAEGDGGDRPVSNVALA